eukprot:9074511-Alexandrium_andersonii.AAC.1
MAESPLGRGRASCAEARNGPLRAVLKQAPHRIQQRSDRATWGAAPRRPKLLCKSVFARSMVHNWGRL